MPTAESGATETLLLNTNVSMTSLQSTVTDQSLGSKVQGQLLYSICPWHNICKWKNWLEFKYEPFGKVASQSSIQMK